MKRSDSKYNDYVYRYKVIMSNTYYDVVDKYTSQIECRIYFNYVGVEEYYDVQCQATSLIRKFNDDRLFYIELVDDYVNGVFSQ